MQKRLKFFFLFILFLIILLGGLCYVTFHTTAVSRWLIRRLIAQNLPDYKIQSLTIKNQNVRFPREFELERLQITLNSKGGQFEFLLNRIRLDLLNNFFFTPQDLHLAVMGFNLASDQINVHSLELENAIHFNRGAVTMLKGQMKSADVDLYSFKMKNISAEITGNSKTVYFKNFISNSYDGELKGHIDLKMQPKVIFTVDMNLVGLSLKKMEKFNEAIFSNMEGNLYGTIIIIGNPQGLNSLDVDLKIDKDAKIRASMMQFFLQNIPLPWSYSHSKEKEELDALARVDGKVPVEDAQFGLKSFGSNKLSGLFKMSSRKVNLNLNVPIDINTDGQWGSLLEYWQGISKKGEE